MGWSEGVDRYFRITERGSTISTEVKGEGDAVGVPGRGLRLGDPQWTAAGSRALMATTTPVARSAAPRTGPCASGRRSM